MLLFKLCWQFTNVNLIKHSGGAAFSQKYIIKFLNSTQYLNNNINFVAESFQDNIITRIGMNQVVIDLWLYLVSSIMIGVVGYLFKVLRNQQTEALCVLPLFGSLITYFINHV